MQQVKKISLQSEMMVPALTPFKTTNTNQKRILDGQTSSSNTETGFSNVPLTSYSSTPISGHHRRSSNTSIASDISFLPRYDSPTNFYHMQSDLDISASEVEDNASTSSQLGHLTKEQIYSAFQKAQMRYHKYRGRYTDIAKHYKDLERENAKIRSVLVETQDKALRRMAELREQCALEQKAKAHLENSLRVDLDEKQYVIDSLKTKVDLLQNSKSVATDKNNLLANLSDSSTADGEVLNLDILTKDLKDARTEIESLNIRLQEMKANAIVFNSKESDFKKKIAELEEINKQKSVELSEVLERERENNLIMAQTKMELHTEIQNRDLKIEQLKRDVENLKSDLDNYQTKSKASINSNKLENFQIQNAKLIEKVEELTQKCNNYESELLKMEQFKIENQNLHKNLESNKKKIEEYEKYIKELDTLKDELKQQKLEYEDKMSSLRDNTKQSLLTLESKIKNKLQDDFTAKEEALTTAFQDKLHLLTETDDNTKETQLKLLDKIAEIKNFEIKQKELEENLQKEKERYTVLEMNHLDLIGESSEVRAKLSELQKKNHELFDEIIMLQNQNSEQQKQLLASQKELSALCNDKTNLQKEFETVQNSSVVLQNEVTKLRQELDTLKESNVALQNENTQLRSSKNGNNLVDKLKAIITDLQSNVTSLQNEKTVLVDQYKLLQNENTDLQSKIEKLQVKNLEVVKLNVIVTELTERSSQLEFELNQVLHNNEEYQKKLAMNENTIAQQEQQVIAMKSELDGLQEVLKETKAKLTETENEKSAAEERLKVEKVKIHEEIQSLNLEIMKFKEHNSIIQGYIDEYKQKLTEYERRSAENTLQLQNLNSENVTLKNEVVKLKELVETSDSINNRLTQQLNNLTEENYKIKALEELCNSHIEDTNLSFAEKVKHIIELNLKLKETLSTQENDQSNLGIQLQDVINENNHLKEQVLQFEREATAKNKNYEDIKLQVIDYEQKCKSLSDEIAVLNDNFERYKTELLKLQNIQTDYKALQDKQLQLSNDFSNTQATISEVNAEKQKLLEEICKFKEQERVHNEKFAEHQDIKEENTRVLEEIAELKGRNNELSLDYKQIIAENEEIVTELAETKLRLETILTEKQKHEDMIKKIEVEKVELLNELKQYRNELDQLKRNSVDLDSIKEVENLVNDNKNLKLHLSHLEEKCEACEKQRKSLEIQLCELENQYTEISHEKQLLQDEIQELKISPINSVNTQKLDNLDIMQADTIYSLETPNDVKKISDSHQKEIDDLNEQLVQYRSLDLTNRSSIQFYENELQKIKNKNEKLSRKLDETLVTLNHFAELSHSTETEYLKNVLYNYMLGKESLVLARVIAAVCKFDESQTNAILQREQQKQTLLGQLGLL